MTTPERNVSKARGIVRLCSTVGLYLAVVASSVANAQVPDTPFEQTIRVKTTGTKPPIENIASAACFPVGTIEISGELVIDPALIEAAVQPFAYSCQGNETVGAIVKSINGLYAQKGFITTQAYLPQQDISQSRKLLIAVVPGRIDEIDYSEIRKPYENIFKRMANGMRTLFRSDSGSQALRNAAALLGSLDDGLDRLTLLGPAARKKTSVDLKQGDILQLDELQQSLDGLNRVRSSKAKAKLEAGAKPATSRVVIQNRIDDTFRLYAGYDTDDTDNSDTEDTLRFGFTAEKDNLIGINDTWYSTLKSGINSNKLTAGASIPYKRFTFSLSGEYSEDISPLTTSAELFTQSWEGNFTVSYLLKDTKQYRTTIFAGLGRRHESRFINSAELTPQDVSILAVGVDHIRYVESGVINASLSGNFGLPILGAMTDPDGIKDDTPHAQFRKINASVGYTHAFPGIATFSTVLAGQYSPTALFTDDQLFLGSRSTVRGFSSAKLRADSGYYWRNEMTFALPAQKIFPGNSSASVWARDRASKLNPYAFIDVGHGWDKANETHGVRSGAGLGLRYGGPVLSFDVGYAFRLSDNLDGKTGEAFASVRVKIF